MRSKKETIEMVQRFAAGEPIEPIVPQDFIRDTSESMSSSVWERIGMCFLVLFLLGFLFFSSLGWMSILNKEPYFSNHNLVAGATYGLIVAAVADCVSLFVAMGVLDTIFRFFCWFATGQNKGLFFGKRNLLDGSG